MTGYQPLASDEFPSLAAGVLLFDGDGPVLLVHQDYGQRMWSLPGGMLDAGEAPHEAAIREVREEVGVNVALQHLVGVYYLRRRHPGIRFVFLGEVLGGGVPHITDDELDDLGWFAPDGLPDGHMLTLPVAIADARAGLVGVARSIDDQT